jgi:prepilin-type N-terminal cleavage/methylation domain-containing protein
MKNEQGFSLIELLIVVAIIAIIAAIAVPSMLQARMAANESSAIQGCRTVGSAEVAYAAINNQSYATLDLLRGGNFVDSRFTATGFNGYGYADGVVAGTGMLAVSADQFGVVTTPAAGKGRYSYGISTDQIVRYQAAHNGATAPLCGATACTGGEAVGASAPNAAAPAPAEGEGG